MTERSAVILELARNELLRSGEDAASFAVLSVGFPLLRAGRALDDVLGVYRGMPEDQAALRRAAHRAIGALEEAFTRLQHVRHPEAYQVLLDLAYL
jgi:hypothetical protein